MTSGPDSTSSRLYSSRIRSHVWTEPRTRSRWQAEYEWSAHAPMAREHGVAGAVVGAIGRGEDPPFEADDERAVYAVASQLGHSGRLDQETYDAAHRLLGDAGMVELVSLCGYYTLISFLLNAFAVPLPPDALPMRAGS